jgi:hypothetical protein
MQEHFRWYDKDKKLDTFMLFLQNLPQHAQIELANDILINLPNVIGCDYDEFLNKISKNNLANYKRWYDADLALHSAVEVLKELEEHQVEMLIHVVSDTILKISKMLNERKRI